MKPALLFLVKFVCLTAPFVWLWQMGGLNVYHAVYSPIASAIYEWLGYEGVATPVRIRYINFIPFLALMVLTPNLTTRRRLGGAAIGLVILFSMHIAVNLTADPWTLALPRPISLSLDAAPFVLWVVIANEFVLNFMSGRAANAAVEESTESRDA
jgi:hypothetical protein